MWDGPLLGVGHCVGWAIACHEAVAAFETALTAYLLTVYRKRLCTIGVTCVVT
jgi:hypothetical protein